MNFKNNPLHTILQTHWMCHCHQYSSCWLMSLTWVSFPRLVFKTFNKQFICNEGWKIQLYIPFILIINSGMASDNSQCCVGKFLSPKPKTNVWCFYLTESSVSEWLQDKARTVIITSQMYTQSMQRTKLRDSVILSMSKEFCSVLPLQKWI